jgi:AraC family transcriptional regulator
MFHWLKMDRRVNPELRVRDWRYPIAESFTGPAATHAAVEVAWVESGALVYRTRGVELSVLPGQAIVIPAHEEHVTQLRGPGKYGSVWLGAERMRELADAMGTLGKDAEFGAGIIEPSQRVIALGQLLQTEVAEASFASDLAADALSESLAIQALRSARAVERRVGLNDPRIRAAVEFIETCFADAISLDQLAKAAGMSRFHFSRAFREQVGESPYRFLIKLRLRRAARLLRIKNVSVTEAALTVGFQDLSRFARMFRAEFGCAPAKYGESRSLQRRR